MQNYPDKIFGSDAYAMSKTGKKSDKTYHGGQEAPWYELYNLFFFHHLARRSTITHAPQYPVTRMREINDYGPDFVELTEETMVPDFALLRSLVDISHEGPSFDSRVVMAVVENKPLLCEVPPNATRDDIARLTRPEFSLAKNQAKDQARYVFEENSTQPFVFAMHCVGPYWNYTMYTRDKISPYAPDKDPHGDYVDFKVLTVDEPSSIVKIETPEAHALFEEMLAKMRGKFAPNSPRW